MKKYHYQENININVEVEGDSIHDARSKVVQALGLALNRMFPLEAINKDIKSTAYDTIKIEVTEIKEFDFE